MGFLIPTARPDPGILTRFGRLLHWTALGLAALMLLPAYFAVTQLSPASFHPASAVQSVTPQYTPQPTPRAKDGWEMFDARPGDRPAPQPALPAWVPSQQGLPLEVWLFFAAAFALIGRAARYLFAGE